MICHLFVYIQWKHTKVYFGTDVPINTCSCLNIKNLYVDDLLHVLYTIFKSDVPINTYSYYHIKTLFVDDLWHVRTCIYVNDPMNVHGIILNSFHISVQLSYMYIIHDMYVIENFKICSYKRLYVDSFSKLFYQMEVIKKRS